MEGFSQDSDTNDKRTATFSRRSFLAGLGALAGTAALRSVEAEAAPFKALSGLSTHEELQANVENISAYSERIRAGKAVLENISASKREILDLILPAPVTEADFLRGTEYDPEAARLPDGSINAVQVRTELGKNAPIVRFSSDPNTEDGSLLGYGNAFFVGDTFVSNRHVFENRYVCEVDENGADIAGASLDDLDISTDLRSKISHAAFLWDRKKAKEELNGEFVHVESIHELLGRKSDSTEILSGVAIKVTEAFLWAEGKDDPFFSEQATKAFKEKLLHSYMFIAPPIDYNGDAIINSGEITGISGSPVITNMDAQKKNNLPSGIAWGVGSFYDQKTGTTYAAVYFHGPDALGSMIDEINTIVSGTMDDAIFPQKKALTEKVQAALHAAGYDIAVDGRYGKATQMAVFDFQKRHFDRATLESQVLLGDVDRMTWDALFPGEAHVDKHALYQAAISQ